MESLNFWKGKEVFLTGHTGFKGSWMSLWLLKAGANVTGYSIGLPTTPSLFEDLKISDDMNSIVGDICDAERLKAALLNTRPEIVIHMAAQPLVRYSYKNPVETYMTNVIGVVNLYEAIRETNSVRAVLNVTSDKCYENKERPAGYCEDDAMGGYDPYSSSKGCAELVTSAYRRSFFSKSDVLLASGRAGNVIGGGDWAADRIVPDIVRSVMRSETLIIRNPNAVRPWQHVLEPIGGYLNLVEKMYLKGSPYAEGFNFGPMDQGHCTVNELIQKMNTYWQGQIKYKIEKSDQNLHEAHLLGLNCTKANVELGWFPRWSIDETLQRTVEWNIKYMNSIPVREICLKQLDEYERKGHV